MPNMPSCDENPTDSLTSNFGNNNMTSYHVLALYLMSGLNLCLIVTIIIIGCRRSCNATVSPSPCIISSPVDPVSTLVPTDIAYEVDENTDMNGSSEKMALRSLHSSEDLDETEPYIHYDTPYDHTFDRHMARLLASKFSCTSQQNQSQMRLQKQQPQQQKYQNSRTLIRSKTPGHSNGPTRNDHRRRANENQLPQLHIKRTVPITTPCNAESYRERQFTRNGNRINENRIPNLMSTDVESYHTEPLTKNGNRSVNVNENQTIQGRIKRIVPKPMFNDERNHHRNVNVNQVLQASTKRMVPSPMSSDVESQGNRRFQRAELHVRFQADFP